MEQTVGGILYCSKRNCYNSIYGEQNNHMLFCKEHYDELQNKLKAIKLHTPENCFCGKDHTKKK